LDEFLQRENNLVENLIQIYKQFIRLHTTSEGHIQLNKKLCIIESLKLYIEHLALFNKFDFILPPAINLNESNCALQSSNNTNMKNYFNEIQISLKIISNRWIKRRQEQNAEYKHNLDAAENAERNFPFTYMIDCIVEECELFAATSKFLIKKLNHKKQNENKIPLEECDSNLFESNSYPPKSINDLLEICLECNISTQMKQIVILYVLCDLMHTELSSNVQKHISKLINAYCTATFTLMSTGFDSSQSISWTKSLKSTSIKNIDTEDSYSENTTCLFDFVNGIYLIDSHHLERAFSCLRNTDLTFLEFYEKYFILYNSVHVKQYKIAAQYLWLFQKLNVSSISTSEINNLYSSSVKNNDEEKNSIFYNIFTKSSFSSNLSSTCLSNKNVQIRHEQIMHFKLIITIYLANHLVNEAYDLIKTQIKSLTSTQSNVDGNNLKSTKELVIYFFFEVEKCKKFFAIFVTYYVSRYNMKSLLEVPLNQNEF
jgi:hypothetical protein